MDLISIFTIFSFVFFIIIVLITYRKSSSKVYDDIANLIIKDDDNIYVEQNFYDKSYNNKMDYR